MFSHNDLQHWVEANRCPDSIEELERMDPNQLFVLPNGYWNDDTGNGVATNPY